MTHWEAAFLGFVQGATEFLPVSSSGHLVIAQQTLGLSHNTFTFDIFLHFATLIAVFLFFWKDIRILRLPDLPAIVIASIPAAIIGIFFDDVIEALASSLHTTGWELLITAGLNFGCAYLLSQQVKKTTAESSSVAARGEAATITPFRSVSPIQATVVGLFQALAILPAVSRSGATVFGGLLTKLNRQTAFAFSFIISIPAILGANLLEVMSVLESPELLPDLGMLLVGSSVALVVGLASLYLLRYMISHAKFQYFGWYALILGVSVIVFQ